MTTSNYDGEKCLNLYSMPTFLDPSSVEVELNPEVFPESEIEWMKVDAMCGWRPSKNFVGAFDAVIKAVEDGTLTEERINQSVRRILKMKTVNNMSNK